ncbi:MAG: 50S ribosomal protein L23 [Patescibacteria group bacterium]|nr:50S ribosomal protein L23 [Patescibacteria group bacterium]
MSELTVITRPVVTEKATDLAGISKYVFIVKKDATKVEVKKAVEKIYGAKVGTIRIIKTHPKKRMLAKRRELIKKPELKKAIVTLRKGEKAIDVNKINVKQREA